MADTTFAAELAAAAAAGAVADPTARAGVHTSPRLAVWHRKVAEEAVDTNILVMGDSTGAEATPPRWVRALADRIAAQWPRQTLVYRPWDDTTKTYPAGSAVTVQTGASGRTITLYNASVSGQVVGYAMNTAGVRTGITTGDPDVIVFNYGHNSPQDPDNYRAITHQAVNVFATLYVNAAIVLTGQNPRATVTTGITAAADYAPDQARQRAQVEYAAAEALPCIDVNAAFRAYGDYATDLLADGVHPNAAGTALWADLAWSVLRPKPLRTATSPQMGVARRVWVPATQFLAASGAPTLALTAGGPAWLLDPDVSEGIAALIDYPSDWKLVDIELLLTVAAAPPSASRTAVFNGEYRYVGGTNDTRSVTAMGAWVGSPSGAAQAVFSTVQDTPALALAFSRFGGSRKPLGLRLTRDAANAADTLAQDVGVLGAFVHRMY